MNKFLRDYFSQSRPFDFYRRGTVVGTIAKSRCLFNPDGSSYINLGDSDAYSFGNGTTDIPFTIAGVIEVVNNINAMIIIGKYDNTTGLQKREWYVLINNVNKLRLALYDESSTSVEYRDTDAALSVGFHTFVVTYSGVGGVGAANGIIMYIDGSLVASTRFVSGTYTAMENLTTECWIAAATDAAAIGIFMLGDFTPPIIDKGNIWSAMQVLKWHGKIRKYYGVS